MQINAQSKHAREGKGHADPPLQGGGKKTTCVINSKLVVYAARETKVCKVASKAKATPPPPGSEPKK